MHIKTDGLVEKAIKLKEGEVEVVVSTNAWDAHGERINVEGIDLKDFKKNPAVLWAHDGFNLPIGRATKIWKDGRKLMAKVQFYLNDEFPAKVYQYVVDGFLKAVSIGGTVEEWGEDGVTIERLNMKEFSFVSIPANAEALVSMKALDKEQRNEFTGLAKIYARKMLSDGQIHEDIARLEKLVTTLKEVAFSEPQEETVASHRVVVLRSAQAVDKQTENIIRSIKISLKGDNQNV